MNRRILAATAVLGGVLALTGCEFAGSGSAQGTGTVTRPTTSAPAPTTTTQAPVGGGGVTPTYTTTPAPTTTSPVGTPGVEAIGEGFYRVTTADDDDIAANEILPGTYATVGADGPDAGTAPDNCSYTRYATVEGTGDSIIKFRNVVGEFTFTVAPTDASVLLAGPCEFTLEEPTG